MKRFPILLLALCCALAACEKGETDAPTPPDKTPALTTPKWRLTADVTVAVLGGITTTTDEYAGLLPCQKDNFIKFGADKKAEFNEGDVRCAPTDPQTQTTPWDFNADQTRLILTDPVDNVPFSYDITELSATTLKLTQKTTNGADSNTEVRTYTAI